MNKLLSIEQSYVGTWKNRNKMEQWGRISWILCPKSNLFLITAIADTAMNNKWVANLSAFHVNLCDFVQKYRISKLNIHIFWFGYQMAEKKLTLLCLHGFVGVRVFGLCEFFILHYNITESRVYISNHPIDRRSLQNDSFWNSSVDTSDKCKYLNLILATIRIFPLHRQFKIIKALLLLMYLRALTEFVYFSRSHVRLLPLFLSHARYLPLSC